MVKPSSYFCKYDLRDGFWSVPVERGSRRRLVMRHPGTGRLLQSARLPFGYLDSPRLFCSVTEAIAGELRKRAAGMGIHVLCFVDDFLVIGDTEELARLGGAMLEAILEEFGLEWAPHKQRGPTQCIEFLGLLICNVQGARCIALTESRQTKLRAMIDEWLLKRPREGSQLQVEPKELARLLGNLVFASQVIPGGRTYMQGMLSSFRGLEVDWRHGRVRPTRGSSGWQQMRVGDAFWRDLEWFDDHFENRNCVPMEQPVMGEAAITGTDASGWGAGQLAWIDGGREEVQLEFTEAEQRRPINWRELLGILRVVEFFGERLRGRLVLIETDNMAAKCAASKMASSAPDMQELIRRLLEAAGRYGIKLRFTHTPGVKLHRPDQTSRGDPVEEPRVRLIESEYRVLEERFGPFTEMLGAERAMAVRAVGAGGEARIFMHPTYTTVASALRLLGERMGRLDGAKASGIIIVPRDESAAWWPLTRHFSAVGGWGGGSPALDINRLGKWCPARCLRDTIVLAFPRGAGGVARPIWASRGESWGDGYVLEPTEQKAKALPLSTGAFVYSQGVRPGSHGVLYMVWKPFGPKAQGAVYMSEESDLQAVSGAQLTRSLVASGKRRGFAKEGGEVVYQLNLTRDAKVADRAFAPGGGCRPWQQGADLLWSVDHLVKEMAAEASDAASMSGTLEAKRVALRRFTFDYKRAEQEIARGLLRREQMASLGELTAVEGGDALSPARPALEGLRRSRRGQGELPLGETMRSPERMERRLRAEKRVGIVPPTEQMAALELGVALAPAAAEAALEELTAA